MKQLNPVCLSLTVNLRCIGFTLGQSSALIIPPAIELVISLFFVATKPGRRAQIPLAADTVLYFIWALLDMLSLIVPAARNSLSVYKALNLFIGAVSFTPILVYSTYVYRLSCLNFIPGLPRNLQPYLEISLPALLLAAVALNEASSFVGTHLGTTSSGQPVVDLQDNSEFLWLSLSQSSLAVYTTIQFFFFLLAFTRLSRAFLDQRRIERTQSDERHFFHGIAWINAGIILGVIETITGFARTSFIVALARRMLRLVARGTFMFGLLKGLDLAEDFERLVEELRGVPRIGKRISYMLGVNSQRTPVFHSVSQIHIEHSQVEESSPAKEKTGNQRVTVHYEKGQAPLLQIRFSALDFPTQAALADVTQQRRRSHSGLSSGLARSISMQQRGQNVSNEMTAARNAVFETPRAKSLLMATDSHSVSSDWIQPPERIFARPGSGATISDSLSIVRDLERKFPSLPPRVTGKYRGSILGQNYEEDPYPVVGVSRQSSMRRDGNAQRPSEEGGTTVALSSSGSIKRKPAPPLLDGPACLSDQCKRPASTWGGLTQNMVGRSPDSPMIPNTPQSTTVCGSDHALIQGDSPVPTPFRARRMNARDLIKRASRALSDASIRSAEWLASASTPQAARTPLTVRDIEMYRTGNLVSGSTRPRPDMGEAILPLEHPVSQRAGESTEHPNAHSEPSQPRVSISRVSTRTTPTSRNPGSGTSSRHASVNLLDNGS